MSGTYEPITVYVIPRGGKRENLTDRARRYRATAEPPAGARICGYCGSRRNVEVDHINGFEDDDDPKNKLWICRRCNTKKGALFARLGLGRRTRQFNAGKRRRRPAAATDRGAQSYGQWLYAVMSAKGESDAMTVPQAVEMIRATPEFRRTQFAYEIWSRRRERGTDKTAVPF